MGSNPSAEVLHLGLRLLDRGGVESGIEHVVDGMSINRLLVLSADFKDAASEGRLKKRCYGQLCELLGRLLEFVFAWLLGGEGLLRCGDLRIGVTRAH